MCDYSEFEMANSFELSLKQNRIVRLNSFDFVFREVLCQQGVADFVAINSNGLIDKYNIRNVSSVELSCKILSLLKLHSGRAFRYIQSKMALNQEYVERLLKELQFNGCVKFEKGLYYRCIQDVSRQINVWAFELKLTNWKRALFQALQYKAVSNYSVVVFPYNKESVLKTNLHFFVDMNVGVLLYDMNKNQSKWIYYPKKELPISKWNALFTLGKLIQTTDSNEYVMN